MARALGRKPAIEWRAAGNTPDDVSIDQTPGIVERLISVPRTFHVRRKGNSRAMCW